MSTVTTGTQTRRLTDIKPGNLGDLVRDAEHGTETVITRNRQNSAVLIGYEQWRAVCAVAADLDAARADGHLAETTNDRGLMSLPALHDRHGETATGSVRLAESSSVDPAMWFTAEAYPQRGCNGPAATEVVDVGLHLYAWQARVLAAQLIFMADHVDPGRHSAPDGR